MQITPDVQLAACSADPAAFYHAAAPGADADADEILGSEDWLVVPPSAARRVRPAPPSPPAR